MKAANLSLLFALALMPASTGNAKTVKYHAKRVIIFVFFLLPFAVYGKSELCAHLGLNMCHLQSRGGKTEPSFSIGMTRDFYSKKGLVSLGIQANNYKVNFYDKSCPAFLFYRDNFILVKNNFFINAFYLELPIKVGYFVSVLTDRFNIIPFAGLSVSVLIKDKTKTEYISDYDISFRDRKNIVYDFLITDEEKTRLVIGYKIGVDISFKRFILGLSYHHDLNRSKRFAIYQIQDAFSTFRATVKYSLKTYSKDGGVL